MEKHLQTSTTRTTDPAGPLKIGCFQQVDVTSHIQFLKELRYIFQVPFPRTITIVVLACHVYHENIVKNDFRSKNNFKIFKTICSDGKSLLSKKDNLKSMLFLF